MNRIKSDLTPGKIKKHRAKKQFRSGASAAKHRLQKLRDKKQRAERYGNRSRGH